MKIGIVLLVAVFCGVAQAQDESVVETVVAALETPKNKAIATAAWLLKEFPSSGARVDSLFPDSIIVDEIPVAVKERVDVPVNFAHKGNAIDKTTFYAGMEVAEVFSWWQNPRKYTVDEYVSMVGAAASAYFVYDQYIKSDGDSGKTPPTPATATASSGGRSASLQNFSGNFRIRIEDHESGSGVTTIEGNLPTDN